MIKAKQKKKQNNNEIDMSVVSVILVSRNKIDGNHLNQYRLPLINLVRCL